MNSKQRRQQQRAAERQWPPGARVVDAGGHPAFVVQVGTGAFNGRVLCCYGADPKARREWVRTSLLSHR